ncbi:MAG: hypothetical protein KQH63_20060 [Desulfobulbaceae bacterium]|nr:hypothetical protein [Desulfobulbaceae bacterium]
MKNQANEETTISIKLRISEFLIPPVTDALVIGNKAPIGCVAMNRALSLLHVAPFTCLEIEDDTVEGILVRNGILKKISEENLVLIIKNKVKSIMSSEEVLHLDIDMIMSVEVQL